jgi:murein DD-endopeptidase MepM/ murein hydrolase activator NlpD
MIMEGYFKRFMLIVLTALLLSSCGDDGPSIPFSYDCSVFPDQGTSEYILPYEVGSSFKAIPHAAQTSLSTQSIAALRQFYAIDIIMPNGTPLVASRSGTVVRIEEQFFDGDNQVGHENFIIVEHDDGTFSRYFHLTNNGALVNVGDTVLQLDTIATSGNTGNSSEPHLHFDVTDEFCDPNSDINNELRECQTLPVTFRNTRSLDCGLEWRETYMALSF